MDDKKMTKEKLFEALSITTSAIRPISSQSIDAILDAGTIENHQTNALFMEQNETDSSEYFVLSGWVRAFINTSTGDEITLNFYPSNYVLPPHYTRSENDQNLFSFQALTDVVLLKIDNEKFQELQLSFPDIMAFTKRFVELELFNKSRREIALTSHGAKQRLIEFRERFKDLEDQIHHTYIASYLGVAPAQFSRIKKSLDVAE